MSLISQPGSDYQLTQITLDAGNARDITLLLTDVHGLLADLCLDPAQPQLTAHAQAILADCDSLYTPQALPGALDQVITQLIYATRDALALIQPPPPPGARSKENHRPAPAPGGARSEENSGATSH
ncbi:hypothetical protein [Trebonia sp.]|uniref:hypothetical protein n=1 Tax=Trebonia sp. TaxID=2767075 RepID=UPI00262F06E9|nr:hypothetical protein [Trebonia sp.]